MGQMVQYGRRLIRINPSKRTKLQYSTNDGRDWHGLAEGYGEIRDLIQNGKELLMQTDKGLYCSTNEGRSWHRRSS